MNSSTGQSPTAEELDAFFQSSQTYYVEKWQARRRSGGSLAGFHWPAFFFSAYWFAYRRMWKAAVCCYVVGALLAVALSGTGLWLVFGLLTFRCALGLGANPYYFATANSLIAAAKRESTDPVEQTERLKRQGGTSDAAIMVLLIVNLLVWLGAYFLGVTLRAA